MGRSAPPAPLQGPSTWSPTPTSDQALGSAGQGPTPLAVPASRRGRRGVAIGVLAVLVALLVGAAAVTVAVVSTSDDSDDVGGRDVTEQADAADAAPVDVPEAADREVEPPVPDCPTSAYQPEFKRIWQDGDGIHVVIVIHTTCEVDLVLSDPGAQFAAIVDGEVLVAGTFDLSASEIGIPAGGTSGEIELLYDPTGVRAGALRFRVTLPEDEAQAVTAGVGVRYLFVCEPADGDVAVQDEDAISTGPANLVGGADVSAVGTLPVDPALGDDAAAQALLDQIHAEQAPVRERISGQWVPQVATKSLQDWPSTPADDRLSLDFFKNQEILHTPSVFLERFRAWQARYPGAVLIRGSDFDSICGYGEGRNDRCLAFWIIAIDAPQASGEAVFFDWCGPEGLNELSPDDNNRHCIGKIYQQTDSSGTTFNR